MKTSLPYRAAALLAAAGLSISLQTARAEEPTFRDLVRKYVSNQTAGAPPQKLPGLPAEVQKIVALEYTVLLRKDGQEEPIDAAAHQFNVGDQIRLRIKPVSGLYIYIFHEGASGERTCLLPTDKEKPPLANPDKSLDLPLDGSVFEFSPPAGEEKLIVVATDEPSDDLAALSSVVFKKPGDELTSEEKTQQEKLKARNQQVLKSIRERQAQGTRYRGLFSDDAVGKVAAQMKEQGTTRAILEEPPSGKQTSTFAMSASLKEKPVELFVTIPLTSVAKKGATSK